MFNYVLISIWNPQDTLFVIMKSFSNTFFFGGGAAMGLRSWPMTSPSYWKCPLGNVILSVGYKVQVSLLHLSHALHSPHYIIPAFAPPTSCHWFPSIPQAISLLSHHITHTCGNHAMFISLFWIWFIWLSMMISGSFNYQMT